MERMLSRFDFYLSLRQTKWFPGWGLDFSLDKVKAFIFCNCKVFSTMAISPYTLV